MKYLKQLMIILAISFSGECLQTIIPLPIAGSIYGLFILFALLQCKLIKVEDIKETAEFLLAIMPLLFVPAFVGLLGYWDVLKPILLPVLVMIALSTIFVMVGAGKTTQWLIKQGGGHDEGTD